MTDNSNNFNLSKICSLAKLKIPENQHPKIEEEIHQILDLADKVQNPLIQDLQPLYHPRDLMQTMRVDTAIATEKSEFRDKLLDNAPSCDDENFLVPKVIE